MHQTFATTILRGRGNSEDIDIALSKAWVYAQQVHVNAIVMPILGTKSKPLLLALQ